MKLYDMFFYANDGNNMYINNIIYHRINIIYDKTTKEKKKQFFKRYTTK